MLASSRASRVPGVLFAVTVLSGFAALNTTSVANATLIGNLTPVIVLAVARGFMHERIRGQQYIAAGVAVAGIIVVVLGPGKTAGAAFSGDSRVKRRRDTVCTLGVDRCDHCDRRGALWSGVRVHLGRPRRGCPLPLNDW